MRFPHSKLKKTVALVDWCAMVPASRVQLEKTGPSPGLRVLESRLGYREHPATRVGPCGLAFSAGWGRNAEDLSVKWKHPRVKGKTLLLRDTNSKSDGEASR